MTQPARRPLVVMNIAAFNGRLLASKDCPHLAAYARACEVIPIEPVFPALTLPMQATIMTGRTPSGHGVVGNGFFDRTWMEHRFWNASARLLDAPPFWETEAGRAYRAGALFWWHCLGGGLDCYLNVAPIHTHTGKTVSSCYSDPPDLYPALEKKLGPFPLHRFWGPGVSIESSAWILSATEAVLADCDLDLLYTYLPHMDYELQRSGPGSDEARKDLAALDDLLERFLARAGQGDLDLIILSEYGIAPVHDAVSPNRHLKDKKMFQVRTVEGRNYPDLPGSRAFALCDHQVAHVYIQEPTDLEPVARLLTGLDGVGSVLKADDQARLGIDHPRSGDLVAMAAPGWWFDYRWWDDDRKAPDYAFTVDIHRKIGYDPLELVLDSGRGGIAADPALIRGSHGLINGDPIDGPLVIASREIARNFRPDPDESLPAARVSELIAQGLAGGGKDL